jgi:hypothetical protein
MSGKRSPLEAERTIVLRPPLLALAAILLSTLAPTGALANSQPDVRALFAQERAAAGGAAWDQVAAIEAKGTVISGGAPSTFVSTVQRQTGFQKTVAQIGPLLDTSGFDGMPWDAQNGTLTTIDMPGDVADAVTGTYQNRDGWWQSSGATMTYAGEKTDGAIDADVVTVVPTGGSGIDVWIDRHSHLIVRTVAHTDGGDVTQTNDDFRTVNGVRISFHNVSIDPTGAKSETTLSSVALEPTFDPASIARPHIEKRSSFTGSIPSVVPFRFGGGDGGWIVLPVDFGSAPMTVIFDSGGQAVLTPQAAKSLALKTGGGADIGGVGNGSVSASFAHLDSLSAGTAKLSNQSAIVLPLPYAVTHPAAGIDVQGLVGSELLANFKTTVDYDARTIAFAPFDSAEPPSPQTIPFFTDGAHAYIRATIDGVTGFFLIDTGDNGGLTVFRQFANAHGLYAGTGDPFLSPGGVGGQLPGSYFRGKTLTIAGTTLNAPVVEVSSASAGQFASKSIAGNMGARILARFTVTFDYSRHTMTFVPNSHVADPFVGDRTGLSLDQPQPGFFAVLSVAPNSPAAQAGLKAGDRILEVDGRNIAAGGLGGGDLRTIFVDTKRTEIVLVVQHGDAKEAVTLKLRQLV